MAKLLHSSWLLTILSRDAQATQRKVGDSLLTYYRFVDSITNS